MTKDIEPKLKLISDYLKLSKEELFVIPEYQRGYSWNDHDHCDKLWQDIESFMESSEVNESGKKEPYFFGTIIADCSEQNRISLIDGQQRTTTFILLLKALQLNLKQKLDKMKNDDDSRKLRAGLKGRYNRILDILYKTDDDSRLDIIEDWGNAKDISIIENRSINELHKSELQQIVDAEDFKAAEKASYKFPRKKNDNKYTNFFRNFKFFYEKLSHYSESQVNGFARSFLTECQIIEIRSWNTEQAITMFNSLNSTGMPLSDADIISAKLYSNAGDDRTPFMDKWENLTRMTSILNAKKIVGIDSVLQQYMYIKRAEDRAYIREGNLPDVTVPGLRRYYTTDEKGKELLKNPLSLCNNLEKIVCLWDSVKDYPIVKLLLKFNENVKIYLISYLYRFDVENISEDGITDISECLLRLFAVLELVEAGYSSSKFKTFLFGENVKLVDSNVTAEQIANDFKEHISKQFDRREIENRLLEYDKNILVYLNEYLYAKAHGLSFNFSETVNIEHIMPASGHNIDAIRQDAGIDTKEEFDSFANKLGNKILLEDYINSSISNDWFKTKKQKSINDKSGYKDSNYNIAHALIDYHKDTWTKVDIDEATTKIAIRISNFIFNE